MVFPPADQRQSTTSSTGMRPSPSPSTSRQPGRKWGLFSSCQRLAASTITLRNYHFACLKLIHTNLHTFIRNKESQQESQTKIRSQDSLYFNSCSFGIQRGTQIYTCNCKTYLTKRTRSLVQCRNSRCPTELLIVLIIFTNNANHTI